MKASLFVCALFVVSVFSIPAGSPVSAKKTDAPSKGSPMGENPSSGGAVDKLNVKKQDAETKKQIQKVLKTAAEKMTDTLKAAGKQDQLGAKNSTNGMLVRGATRQFGLVPEVLPFTKNLLLNSKDDMISFEGYKVFCVLVNSKPVEQLLNDLSRNDKLVVSFWNIPRLDSNVTFSASEESAKTIIEGFKLRGIQYEILTNNLRVWLDAEKDAIEPNLFLNDPSIGNFKTDKYHTFEEISAFIDLIARKYPSLAKVVTLGQTYEQNPIRGLKFSTGSSPKKMIYIDAGTHAREWITTATALYIIKDFVSGYESNPQIRGLLEKFDFTIVPVINVDGYKYTWEANRMWRKNRVRFNSHSWCVGVDPNRNYDFYWGTEGASADPCSDVYRGPSAMSEAENQAVRNYLSPIKENVAMYMSLHSYGNMVLFPFGTGPTLVGRYNKELTDASKAFNDALYKKNGQLYRMGSTKQILYTASGLSNDWVYDALGIVHSYVAEVGNHEGGFILPAGVILETVESFYTGAKALMEHLAVNEVVRRPA